METVVLEEKGNLRKLATIRKDGRFVITYDINGTTRRPRAIILKPESVRILATMAEGRL